MVARPAERPTNNSPFARFAEGRPSWTVMRIEEAAAPKPGSRPDCALAVLASALVEVCVLWWRKYVRRGAAGEEAA